ncbi:snare associated Golgi protein-domain-containing protein [Dichotomocladium elegans]|nr:snare associated Golgi protein-domain-containing protein [Dichotomocladium elegans]
MEEVKVEQCDNYQPVLNKGHTSAPLWQRLLPRVLLFIIIGLASLLLSLTLAHRVLGIELPHTLEELQSIAMKLEIMANTTWTNAIAVAGVFAALYLWQQAFSIPGSVLFNLLSGYLYGIFVGTVWTSFLTAIGATLAYGLGFLVAEPFLHLSWVSRRLAAMTRQMRREPSVGLFWWLLFARLFPFTPYWFINMVSPFLNIPVAPFFWSTFLGSMPYNFVCAQAGAVLGELHSTADIFSVEMVIKLLIVSFISLVPVVWGNKIKDLATQYIGKSTTYHAVASATEGKEDDEDLEKSNHVELAEATATTQHQSPYSRLPMSEQ